MCLILFALGRSERYPLILAANRDEFYARPTAPAQWWDEPIRWLGGRDLVSGGTWLGITPEGRFAAVTNYRDPNGHVGSISRGQLVLDALRGEPDFGQDYSDCSLIWGTPNELWYWSNRDPDGPSRIPRGLHGLSNHLLDTPWPKVSRGCSRLSHLLSQQPTTRTLLNLLDDRAQAPDEALPDTGVGLTRERVLSPLFVETEQYGTRSSTVILFGADGSIEFAERTPEGTFSWSSSPST